MTLGALVVAACMPPDKERVRVCCSGRGGSMVLEMRRGSVEDGGAGAPRLDRRRRRAAPAGVRVVGRAANGLLCGE